MKRNLCFKSIRLALAVWLFALPLIASPAYAESSGTTKLDTREVFYDERVFMGEDAKQESFFEIGKGQTASKGSYIDLYFSHSTTILPDASSLNVLMDDIPIGSLPLDSANAKNVNWKIDISELNLAPGFHKLTIRPRLKENLLVCENPLNTSAWFVLHNNSTIFLNLVPNYDRADLSLYPSPFIERGGAQAVQSILVVPDDIDQDEFVAAASFSQFFAEQTPGNQLNIPIFTESDVTDKLLNEHSAIWIGQYGKWKGAGKQVIDSAEKSRGRSLQNEGVISLIPTPQNQSNSSLILSGNGAQLRNAAEILTNELLYRQLDGNEVRVPDQLNKPANPKQVETGKPYNVTLEQLGFNNLTLQGVLSGNLQINYTLPGNWDLKDGATLHLISSHSSSIVFQKSVMTVNLNGIPVKSMNLAKSSSENSKLDIRLEPSIIGNDRTLAIRIDYEFVNPTETVQEGDREACALTLLGDWAVIDKSSSFTFTPVERNTIDMQSLPYPFIVDGSWDRTTIVADQLGTRELNVAMTLIGKIGANAAVLDDLSIVTSSTPEIESRIRDRNIIFIGTADKLPEYIMHPNEALVNIENGRFVSASPNVELVERLRSDSGIMQLTPSPLNDSLSLLLIGATSEARYASISDALSNPEAQGSFTGKLVVIDDKSAVYSFPETESQPQPAESSDETVNRWSELTISGPVFAVLAILIVIVLFVVFRLLRVNK